MEINININTVNEAALNMFHCQFKQNIETVNTVILKMIHSITRDHDVKDAANRMLHPEFKLLWNLINNKVESYIMEEVKMKTEIREDFKKISGTNFDFFDVANNTLAFDAIKCNSLAITAYIKCANKLNHKYKKLIEEVEPFTDNALKLIELCKRDADLQNLRNL